jgi:hypothetical protein
MLVIGCTGSSWIARVQVHRWRQIQLQHSGANPSLSRLRQEHKQPVPGWVPRALESRPPIGIEAAKFLFIHRYSELTDIEAIRERPSRAGHRHLQKPT